MEPVLCDRVAVELCSIHSGAWWVPLSCLAFEGARYPNFFMEVITPSLPPLAQGMRSGPGSSFAGWFWPSGFHEGVEVVDQICIF